jgi:hypothetical protein
LAIRAGPLACSGHAPHQLPKNPRRLIFSRLSIFRARVKRDNFRKFPEKNKNHIFPKIELKNAIKCGKMKKNLKIIKK